MNKNYVAFNSGALRSDVSEYNRENKLNKKRFAKLIGITKSRLESILSGETPDYFEIFVLAFTLKNPLTKYLIIKRKTNG